MCGIAGFLFVPGTDAASRARKILDRATSSIAHRGPDQAGTFIDDQAGVALGHRRLAIVDLSAAGDQPMISYSGRFVIIYNGEIYNHIELRKKLEAECSLGNWRGHSDTETLLACIEAWGIEKTLQSLIGMFAFAVWDRKERSLTLARDPIGEKPLYYGWQGRGPDRVFLFGSELKALAVHPSFERRINRDALALYMRHNCIPAPYTIFENMAKLSPGTFMVVRQGESEPRTSRYWDAEEIAAAGLGNPFSDSPEECVDGLEGLLRDAVGRQMMGDVPLGAFLSGGIDSSTVVALMQSQSSRPIKTFSIGFSEKSYDEAPHAKVIARHLGTDHAELYVTPEQAMAVIPQLPTIYDEPFADSSQIPTFLVSQLAKSKVTVALSGDGGDELFGGYNRYQITDRYWRRLSVTPRVVRAAAARAITSISPHRWDVMASAIKPVFPGLGKWAAIGYKLHKGANVLSSGSASEVYHRLISHWSDPTAVVRGSVEPPTRVTANSPALASLSPVERMMALDLVSYLPDDILVKVDRAAMRVSLETRVPLLDRRVVEFAWKTPTNMKLRDGETKWLLRQVLYRHVPKPLLERPKMGFGLPIDAWLRGPLRGWAEDLLDEHRLTTEGYFAAEPIRQIWKTHLSGKADMQHHLWDVLMFQSWLQAQEVGE